MAEKIGRLGRGFDTLIPTNFDSSMLLEEHERIQKLSTGDIEASPDQPRRQFDETALTELSASIKRHGILQPIVVTPLSNGHYTIVAGERRWRAAKEAGLTTIPAIVRTTKDLERLEIALVENVQRVDLSPLEQATSIQRLHEQFNLSYEDIAKRLGKATPTVSNIVRLLGLSDAAQTALREERITEGHARAILALKGHSDKQAELLELIQKNHWTVRQAEQFVTAFKTGARSSQAAHRRIAATTPATEKLSENLKAPVSLRRTAKGGKLEITFKNEADLKRILTRLTKR